MNLNFIRSVLTGLAGVLPILVVFFGCTTNTVTNAISCTTSWIPAEYTILLAGGLGILSFVLKMFGQGGTATENLTSPSVAVTQESKPGTVTEKQVASTSPTK